MKKIIRLTESDLHRIVKECVNMAINEAALKGKSGKTYSLHGNDEESWDIVSRLRQKKSGNSNYNTMRDEKNAEEIDAKNHPNRRSLNNANRVNALLKRTSNASKDIMAANESFIRKIVKESVNRILKETNDHLLTVGGVEDTPFTHNSEKGSYGRTIKGAFNNITYSDNPSRAAIQMMNDKLPFDEFIDYCKKRGINPYDYLDYNDFEVEQWIEDYI